MIIAILKAGILEGKIKLPDRKPEIEIALPLIMVGNYFETYTTKLLSTTPRMRFVWWKQISIHKHEYRLKEILG